jgi:hypothetical protein
MIVRHFKNDEIVKVKGLFDMHGHRTRFEPSSFLALFSDILTLIPIVGDIVGPVFWTSIAYYFWKKGLGLFNWRRFVPEIISFIAELIPGVQELPSMFLGMIIIALLTKIEQKTGINPINLVKGSAISGRLWREFMDVALKKIPKDSFNSPEINNDPSLKPVLRGVWQGGESVFIDTISGKLATEWTPEETKKELVPGNIHSTLYWIDRNDILAPLPF